MKGIALPHAPNRAPQQIDFTNQQVITMALQQIHGKEPGSPGDVGSTVIWH